MVTTKDRIDKIDSILKKNDAPVLKYFRPGLSREEILLFFNERKIPFNLGLVELYEWHNGVDFAENIMQSILEIMPMGMFYDLDRMVRTREDIIEWNYMIDSENFLPLFGSGEDDLHLLKITSGEIFYLSPAANVYGEKEFKSIDLMLDFIIECYEEKILTIDPVNGLNARYDEYYKKLGTYP